MLKPVRLGVRFGGLELAHRKNFFGFVADRVSRPIEMQVGVHVLIPIWLHMEEVTDEKL